MRSWRGLTLGMGMALLVLGGAGCKKKSRDPGPVTATPSPSVTASASPTASPSPTTSPSPTASASPVALRPPERHRAAAGACPAEKGNRNPAWEGCKSDKECAKEVGAGRLNPRCNVRSSSRGPMLSINVCVSDGCMSDADCQGNGPCQCNRTGNYCAAGNCKVDADCASGFCSPSAADEGHACGGRDAGFFCRTANDDCVEDADCKQVGDGADCVFSNKAGKWTCVTRLPCPVG